jgi:hypothetical protein
LEQGGTIGDLQMVDGADKMLDIVSKGSNDVTLEIDTKPFENADKLILLEKCDPLIGGGYYYLEYFEKTEVRHRMWLCVVSEFVFNGLPEQIFIRVLSNHQG